MLKARLIMPAAAAAVLLLTTSACASGNYQRYPTNGPVYRQSQDTAYRNGFDQGRIQGENDARSGRSFDYARHSEYRNAQIGYGGYGNRNEYRDVFRQGFQAGYDDGYRRSARSGYPSRGPIYAPNRAPVYGGGTSREPGYGGTAVYRSAAGDVGYRDGLEQGQKDARSRKAFDPVRAARYRSGDHEYNSRYGSRDEYRREYRAAFQQGYQQGYGVRRY
jgi:hypothetical protein